MKRQVLTLTLATFFGIGAAFAAPVAQDQSQAPAPQQEQAPAPDQAAPAPQGAQRRPVDPNRQLKSLSKKLNLSADQQSQILPILTDRQQQAQAIMSDNTLSPKDRHMKMRALRDDSRGKIESVLNSDQKQAYEQMEQRQHLRERKNAQS